MRRKVKEVVAIVLLLSVLFIFAIKRHAFNGTPSPEGANEQSPLQKKGASPASEVEKERKAADPEPESPSPVTPPAAAAEDPDSILSTYESEPAPDVLLAKELLSEPRYLIIVFGWKRAASLKRLCDSLLKAHYDGVSVDISFHIDGAPSEAVANFVADFKWEHGSKKVVQHEAQIGLVQV
jgi:hypothetical protein